VIELPSRKEGNFLDVRDIGRGWREIGKRKQNHLYAHTQRGGGASYLGRGRSFHHRRSNMLFYRDLSQPDSEKSSK